MKEIQFFSDVKWEIDKESFSGLETALLWVSSSRPSKQHVARRANTDPLYLSALWENSASH